MRENGAVSYTHLDVYKRKALSGAKVIFNLSASPEAVGKHAYLRQLVAQQSSRTIGGYVYCSAGFVESSTDLVFAGNGIIAENGKILRLSLIHI